MAENKKNALVRFWETMEKTVDTVKMYQASRSLQRQAEIDVAKAQETMENAKTALEKAKIDAKTTPEKEFKTIVDKFMDVQIATKKFNDAVAVYKDLFEEEPRLLG